MWSAKLPLFGILAQSITDGPGFRFTLFTQGCPHRCPGCHNPESQEQEGGELHSLQEIYELFVKQSYVEGITFSGGEPFLHPQELCFLAKKVKEHGKNVLCYTGFLYEDLLEKGGPDALDFLDEIDLLIDGPFLQEERDLSLAFRGSANQRLIPLTGEGKRMLEEIQAW